METSAMMGNICGRLLGAGIVSLSSLAVLSGCATVSRLTQTPARYVAPERYPEIREGQQRPEPMSFPQLGTTLPYGIDPRDELAYITSVQNDVQRTYWALLEQTRSINMSSSSPAQRKLTEQFDNLEKAVSYGINILPQAAAYWSGSPQAQPSDRAQQARKKLMGIAELIQPFTSAGRVQSMKERNARYDEKVQQQEAEARRIARQRAAQAKAASEQATRRQQETRTQNQSPACKFDPSRC